jgi:hypothetical protein
MSLRISTHRSSIAHKAGCISPNKQTNPLHMSEPGNIHFPHSHSPRRRNPQVAFGSSSSHSEAPQFIELTRWNNILKMYLKAFLTGALEATDHFGRNTIAPAVGERVKAVNDFGKNTLAPAAGEAVNKANQFRQSHLAPALGEGVIIAGDFKQNVLIPVLGKGGEAIENLGQQVLGPPDEEAVDKSTFARILDKARKLPGEAPKWVKQHPGQTAMYAASGVTLVAPGILAGPVLWAFGWGSTGMRASEFSPSTQHVLWKF